MRGSRGAVGRKSKEEERKQGRTREEKKGEEMRN